MSNRTFDIKTGDTRPVISAELSADSVDVIIDVAFTMVSTNGTVVIDAGQGGIAEQPTTEHGGIVAYQWETEDTATPGTYNAEFTVTFDDGRQETYPNSGYLTVQVASRLA